MKILPKIYAKLALPNFSPIANYHRVLAATECLKKLTTTLCTCINWVQAGILSIGKLGARLHLPFTTLVKWRKL